MFRRNCWWVCFAAMLCPPIATFSFAAEMYRVGVAKVDITPDYPIRLNGFGFRREESVGVSQRIWAKALAISRADDVPIVLIAIDSLGVRLPLVDEVAQRLNEQFGIPREKISLTFSHSHCTPKVNGASDNIFSSQIPPPHQEHIDRYTRELTERITAAAVAAVKNRMPATLEWNVGQVRFAKNRRTPGGPVDHDLPMLLVRGEDGEPRAIYVSYACHCVTLSFNQISGDWSGYAQELIERKFPGAVALVSIGCGSDSNPSSGVTGDKVDVAAQQGAEIADEVARLVGTKARSISGELTARLQSIPLALNELPTREQWEELVKKGGAAGYNAQTQLARLDRGDKLLTEIPYPIQSITFGDSLQMVFLAGEVCVDYSHRLKTELKRDLLWINGYSNDFCAYIPSERLVKEGGYGGGGEIPYFALPATLKAGLEQQIVDEVKRQTPKSFHSEHQAKADESKSPAESLQCLQTHPDLRIELVAAEPLVSDPVAIDFGPDGRLWVAEMTDYARGVNDEFKPTGRVRFLTDTDQDGRYDQATEFLTGLRFPTDVKVWRDGVLVCDAPDILFAADTNGDGKVDVRKTLFTGFATHNPHGRVNSLRWGLDNWLYGSGGLFGGRISNLSGQAVDVANRDFRIQPDQGLIEPVAGQTQQGRPRDDWDNWFGCTNGSLLIHHAVNDRYSRRNPQIAPPASSVYVPDYPDSQRLFPRGELVLFKLSGAPGRPTSACGAEIYRDELLGDEYYGNSFTCEPVNQLVHRLKLSRKGSTFAGRRPANETATEFLTSTDRWFRPVQVRTGPDGALWIVDMYRYVIEHPQWIPPETIAELNVFAGQGLGRIYRIFPKDQLPRKPLQLAGLKDAELAAAIDSPNGIQRDLAQQLLVLGNATAASDRLVKVMQKSQWASARVQAASTLDGLNRLRPELLLALLMDSVPEVRRHAVRLAERYLDQSQELLIAVSHMADDPAPEVRLQIAYSLGESRSEPATTALATLGSRPDNDSYLTSAVLSSVRQDNVVPILRSVVAKSPDVGPSKFVESLLTIAAVTGNEAILQDVVAHLTGMTDSRHAPWCWRTLANVLDAADRRQLAFGKSLPVNVKQQVAEIFAAARLAVTGDASTEEQRIAAIRLIGRDGSTATESLGERSTSNDENQMASLIATRFSPQTQSAAVSGLAKLAGSRAPKLLLARWSDATPALRSELLDTLLSRDEWLEDLFSAMEIGVVKAGDFDATRRQRLLSHRIEHIRNRAEMLLSGVTTSSRREVVAAWQSVTTQPGDKVRGRDVFQKRCAACHQLEGTGFQVGPDLAALTSKSATSLLIAVLDPNRDLDGRYVNYVAAIADGRTIAGMLINESGNSITLREQGGKDHVVLRDDLEELRATGKSVMPEGLEKDMTQQDLADVIAYLLPPRLSPKSVPGNRPTSISPDEDGVLRLLATTAEIYGDEITFESESLFRNIGYWHDGNDYVGWQVQIPSSGRFDVYLDYACAEDSAGNGFRLEGAEPTLRGIVPSTGTWANYRFMRIGSMELPGGKNYLAIRYDGEQRRSALLDLRAVYLLPEGAPLRLIATEAAAAEPLNDPGDIARRLLDGKQPAEVRQKLIADNAQHAGLILAAMVADLPRDSKEEYRRIPWIWRVAIACGKRNQTDELRSVLKVAMPNGGQPLRDWQAVVIGGGIINGVSLAGVWPKQRLEDVLKVEGSLVARWQRSVELAVAMADDEKTPIGTRYDALRMIAMGSWDLRSAQLLKYLAKDVHDELQMGAISAVSDMPHPSAAAAILSGFEHYSQRNRDIALDGLLRTSERCASLLDAVQTGTVHREHLGEARIRKLTEHADQAVRERARQLF